MLKDELHGHTIIYIIKIQLAIVKIFCENVPNPGHVFKKRCSIYIYIQRKCAQSRACIQKAMLYTFPKNCCLLNNFVNKKPNPLLRCFYGLQLKKTTNRKHNTKDKSVNNLQNEA